MVAGSPSLAEVLLCSAETSAACSQLLPEPWEKGQTRCSPRECVGSLLVLFTFPFYCAAFGLFK